LTEDVTVNLNISVSAGRSSSMGWWKHSFIGWHRCVCSYVSVLFFQTLRYFIKMQPWVL